ncbi:MAG: phosphoglucosamine mutase [Pseudomonadota bacterium]|nr:phosphoglucosamine mutase [Pseudomonadota bacterium]
MSDSRSLSLDSRKYFGTDGIRGRVGEWPITAEFMLKLGRAAGVVLGNGEHARVVIGKDTRVSGYMFESALEAGLVAAGADVLLLGPMSTPGVAQLTRELSASAGIVISASHNPHHDNGIKFFSADGEKLDDDTEHAIERETDAPFVTVSAERLGKARRIDDAADRYAAFCMRSLRNGLDLRGKRIVLDCAHGATYHVAPKVFAALGAELHCIGVEPDGFNINREVGALYPRALMEAVRVHGADLGIAFDGDGDRLQMIDRNGALVDGDDLLYVLARANHADGTLRGPVVGTLMTNHGLERRLRGMGIEFVRANVGDRHVMQALRKHGGTLGGEASGHILHLDRASSGDAIVAALAVLEALAQSAQTLDQARAEWQRLPQITINLRIDNGDALIESASVQRTLAQARDSLQSRGRVVLRASGTEPLVRVTVEAEDADEVRGLAEQLARAVTAAANAATIRQPS